MLLQVLAESLQMKNEVIETQLEMLAGPAAVMGQSYWIAVAASQLHSHHSARQLLMHTAARCLVWCSIPTVQLQASDTELV